MEPPFPRCPFCASNEVESLAFISPHVYRCPRCRSAWGTKPVTLQEAAKIVRHMHNPEPQACLQ